MMKKQQFSEKIERDINKISQKMDDLKLELNDLSDSIKDKKFNTIQELDKKKKILKLKHEELKKMTQEKWENSQDIFMDSFESIDAILYNIYD